MAFVSEGSSGACRMVRCQAIVVERPHAQPAHYRLLLLGTPVLYRVLKLPRSQTHAKFRLNYLHLELKSWGQLHRSWNGVATASTTCRLVGSGLTFNLVFEINCRTQMPPFIQSVISRDAQFTI